MNIAIDVLLLLKDGIVSCDEEQKSKANQPDRPCNSLEAPPYMLAGVEALEAIPRVQIERVQQYVSARILEFWLFVWNEIDSAKKFTQTVLDVLVLSLDDMAVIVEFVDGICITLS